MKFFTGRGNRGKISGVFPQGKRKVYRIKLSDGTSIKVSDEHLNVFYTYDEGVREEYCVTTTEMKKLFKEAHEPFWVDCPIVDWESNEVRIDPYLFGVDLLNALLMGEEGI